MFARLAAAATIVLALTAATAACQPPERTWPSAYVTSYGWFDNNPPASAEICCPSVHTEASGTGTYTDPITVAVDYSSGSTLQFAPGDVFYIPHLRAYFVVEDRTGEQQATNTQNHGGTNPHLDVWADGRTSTPANLDACERAMTVEGVTVIEHPASGYAVTPGPLAHNNLCRV